MNEKDIKGFQEVLRYLKEKQKGSFGIGCLSKFEMVVYKYKGLGEGMDYEIMEDYELKELIKQLNKEVEK